MRTPRSGNFRHYRAKAARTGAVATHGATRFRAGAAFCLAFLVLTPAHAQNTIVIGGDGPRGERITVNIGAIDEDRSRVPQGSGDDNGMTLPAEDALSDALTGESGDRLLHFPPRERPRSRLLIGPLADQGSAAPPPAPASPPDIRQRDASGQPPLPPTPAASERPATALPNMRTARAVPPPEARPAALPNGREAATEAPRPLNKPALRLANAPQPSPKPEAPLAIPRQDVAAPPLPAPPPGKPERAPVIQDARAGTADDGESQAQAGREAAVSAAPQPGAAAPERAESEPETESAPATRAERNAEADQLAALPPAEELGAQEDVRLLFASGSDTLGETAQAVLQDLADRMNEAPQSRIQLKAYAAGSGEMASRARRLSLSRALSVRSFLIDEGIRSTRIDVRALGSAAEDGPPDRVDIAPARR